MQYQVFTLIVTLSHVIYMKLFTAYGKKEFWYLLGRKTTIEGSVLLGIAYQKLLQITLSVFFGT